MKLTLSFNVIMTTFFLAGEVLTTSSSPRHADVVIILSGDTGRIEEALELYRIGYTQLLLLSNARETTSFYGDMLQTALSLGIPQDAILTENQSFSTAPTRTLNLRYPSCNSMTLFLEFRYKVNLRKCELWLQRKMVVERPLQPGDHL